MTLHEALKIIREDVEKKRFEVARKDQGICSTLNFIDGSGYLQWEFSNLCKKWPLRSCSGAYPVTHPKCDPVKAFRAAHRAKSMWDMRMAYGRNRMALLEWAIEQTEPEVVE